ncbi:MAG TPA: hydroxysqualene dehydroxylase HpnE [Stellaceae bacterium]|nr:hydroxysqualene dehydroxylase HpnE [Stellaceae bacterium]
MAPRAHIIGAGLAGLSAAVRLAERGWRVGLYEAGPQAGGRCRSYFDEQLGCRIDNGNHLMLSGNRSILAYLATIGAGHSVVSPVEPGFPFVDLATGERWRLVPSRGQIPFWIANPRRRVPGTKLSDYLGFLRMLLAGPDDTVECLVGNRATLFRRFWQPIAVGVLNTEASAGAAALLATVLRETFVRGAAACAPMIAAEGLSESFVDPALAWLALRGATLFTGTRVRSLSFEDERASRIELAGGAVALDKGDAVVVAVPPPVAATLLPGLTVPTEFRPIVNAHFRLDDAPVTGVEITGVIGGTAEWIFRRGNITSVTVSSADTIVDEPAETLASKLWTDVAAALGLPRDLPPARIVKEKRATFAQTPEQVRRRAKARTQWRNIVLAGDWTNTGLPATIEGAIRSGEAAAACLGSATG